MNIDGSLKNDQQLFDMIQDKRNIVQEIFIVKKYILKKLSDIDKSIAPYVNIRNKPCIVAHNEVHIISNQNSIFFIQF